jgi:ATP-dependent Clp protease ATP-binding subunit ClpC
MPNNSIDNDFNKFNQKLTNNAKEALLESSVIAREFHYAEVESCHLLYAIFLRQGSVGSNILSDLGLTKELFKKILTKNASSRQKYETSIVAFSSELKKIFIKAFSIAKEFGYPYIGTEHLAYALIGSKDKLIQELLSDQSINNTPLQISQSLKSVLEPDSLANISKMFNIPEIANIKNKPVSKSATPFIDKFCVNVNTEKSTLSESIIGRDIEIQRMIHILGRKNKNNPLLFGDPGVGKTALITGLAQRINAGTVPFSLHNKTIMSLDIAQLIAGTSFRGEFENRLKEIIREATENKKIILFIDEIHNIVGAGNTTGSLDLANIIKPALARGDFQLIGATTASEHKKHIEKDAALERRFQTIQIHEPSKENTKKILFGIRKYYEKFHNVSISDDAIDLAVELSTQYIQNRFLPDKAIDVIDEAASFVRAKNNPREQMDFIHDLKKLEQERKTLLLEKEKLVSVDDFEKAALLRNKEKDVTSRIKFLHKQQATIEAKYKISIDKNDIFETIAKITGIAIEKISQENNAHIKNIAKKLSARLIGQSEVIESISKTLLRSQAGISNPERPIGSFLFLGPTGVGKTLTAKILAEEFFNSSMHKSKSLIRIDMSELMEKHSISSLIGSPAGYIGYGEGGNLTEKVRRNPYSVILFDEIEKAHPDVFNILLQILEDGSLTDAEGTQVSFKNTIVILTSNIGNSEFINASKVGFESAEKNTQNISEFENIKNHALEELKKKMRPEILNRLDSIFVFRPLYIPELEKISALELRTLKNRIKKQAIEFNFDKKLPALIANDSFSINQGARLIRKNIQEKIEDPIAEMIVYGKVKNGKISANIKNGEIKFV